MTYPYKIYAVGDCALTVELGNTIDSETHDKVIALYNAALVNPIEGVKDIIPAYCTVTWVYDPVKVKKNALDVSAFKYMEIEVNRLKHSEIINRPKNATTQRLIQIPVNYYTDGSFDLEHLAQQKAMSMETLIKLHCERTYRVYLLGFLPGFAYMGSVDARIEAPRLAQPRLNIPAGSVGIAGKQTGVYPLASPGGWQIIGRTDTKLFDAERENPILLQVGDDVKFIPV